MSGLFLDNYKLTLPQTIQSIVFSKYAVRHWKEADNHSGVEWLGHKVIALLEFIPIVGFMCSVAERLISIAARRFLQPAKPTVPSGDGEEKLKKVIKLNEENKVPSPLTIHSSEDAAKDKDFAPSTGPATPDRQAFLKQSFAESFHEWVERAQKDHHFNKGQAYHIVNKFDALLGEVTDLREAEQMKGLFWNWMEKAQRDGHFTEGNVSNMKSAFLKRFYEVSSSSERARPIGEVTTPSIETRETAAEVNTQAQKIEEAVSRDGFIHFYNEKTPMTEFLGNFYPVAIFYKGLPFACAEAAFQAAKFTHLPEKMKEFSDLQGPGSGAKAWSLARLYEQNIRKDWKAVNVDVMRAVLRIKFSDPHLQALLKATGSSYIVEHCPKGRDKFWADNGDGTGANRLGQLLMEIRQELFGFPIPQKPAAYLQSLADSQSPAIQFEQRLPE